MIIYKNFELINNLYKLFLKFLKLTIDKISCFSFNEVKFGIPKLLILKKEKMNYYLTISKSNTMCCCCKIQEEFYGNLC